MTNRFLTLILVTVVLCGTSGPVLAQNPLRRQSEPALIGNRLHAADSNGRTRSIDPQKVTPEVYAAAYNLQNSSAETSQPGQDQLSGSALSSTANQQTPKPMVDENVGPAVHLAEPKNDMAPMIHMLDSLSNRVPADNSLNYPQPIDVQQPVPDRATNPMNRLPSAASLHPPATELESPDDFPETQRAATSKQFDREKFQALVKNLAINTGIVMCIGIGFILVAKQYFKAKPPGPNKKAQSPIQIMSTLKLSPKSNLHLIEAGEHRLIVATDQNGIKSMVPLTDSFANTLGSLENLMDDFTDESSDANGPLEASDSGAYSLATLALKRAQADPVPANSVRHSKPNVDDKQMNPGAKKAPSQTAKFSGNDQDEIRRQMEAALRDHGLKELILETLRKE